MVVPKICLKTESSSGLSNRSLTFQFRRRTHLAAYRATDRRCVSASDFGRDREGGEFDSTEANL